MPQYTVTRRVVVGAAPHAVQAHVADFRRWRDWSPWEQRDPSATHEFTGPERGPGARHTWRGNRRAGAGSMQMVTAEPGLLTLDLRSVRPVRSHSDVEFTFTPQGGGTAVAWTVRGRMAGAAGLLTGLVSLDARLGRDLDRGLTRLKEIAESAPDSGAPEDDGLPSPGAPRPGA